MAKNNRSAPLTPAVLHILLALSTQERHGYGIMKQVELDSQGKVKMGPGTLYGSLSRMINAGLVRESNKRVDPKMDDERRVYYAITAVGRKALAAELQRYDEVVALAKSKTLLPTTHAYGR
jgi:DNA-binding PadR family transcriptional regulator